VARPENLEFIRTRFLPDLLRDLGDIYTGRRRDWTLPADDIFIRSLESHLDWPVQLATAYLIDRTDRNKTFDAKVQQWLADQDWIFVRNDADQWRDALTNMVKTLAVKLADTAEAEARKLAGLPGMYSGWVSACEVARHSKRPGEAALMTDVWVSEWKLIGERPPDEYRREAVLVEEMLLPALVRNYAGSCADGHGRIYYALTPAGWAWLDAGEEPPADDLDGEPDRDGRAFYYERVRAALDRLDTADPPDPKEIGALPLPVAIEGLRLTGPWTPADTTAHPAAGCTK
jgi:hypothetical protein